MSIEPIESRNCRWCNYEFPPMPTEVDMTTKFQTSSLCPECKCFQGQALTINVYGSIFDVYMFSHNPQGRKVVGQ